MSKRVVAWLLAGVSLAALPDGAARADNLRLAQAGSYGGSIGKQDKSVSGEEAAPRAAPRRAPAREPRREATNYDGTWTVQSTGQNCAINTSAAVIVQGRRVFGQGGTGTVSASGAVSTVGSIGALSVTGRGQLSGRSGSGTFRQSDGCVGRWIAVKQ